MKRIIMIIMAVALLALPTMGQEQEEWKSTSIMSGAGGYTAPVTDVGATSVPPSYSPAKVPGGPRRVETPGGGSSGEGGTGHNNPGTGGYDSPVGDAVLPLLLMAFAFGGVIALRRKREGEIS